MRKYQCTMCGHIFDEALGDPEQDVPPGTRWEDVPDDYYCAECGALKADFEMIEI